MPGTKSYVTALADTDAKLIIIERREWSTNDVGMPDGLYSSTIRTEVRVNEKPFCDALILLGWTPPT